MKPTLKRSPNLSTPLTRLHNFTTSNLEGTDRVGEGSGILEGTTGRLVLGERCQKGLSDSFEPVLVSGSSIGRISC
eukprot:6777749-Pyramimonas_sp.AAC.2